MPGWHGLLMAAASDGWDVPALRTRVTGELTAQIPSKPPSPRSQDTPSDHPPTFVATDLHASRRDNAPGTSFGGLVRYFAEVLGVLVLAFLVVYLLMWMTRQLNARLNRKLDKKLGESTEPSQQQPPLRRANDGRRSGDVERSTLPPGTSPRTPVACGEASNRPAAGGGGSAAGGGGGGGGAGGGFCQQMPSMAELGIGISSGVHSGVSKLTHAASHAASHAAHAAHAAHDAAAGAAQHLRKPSAPPQSAPSRSQQPGQSPVGTPRGEEPVV